MPSHSFHIPLVDISPYLVDPSSAAAVKVVDEVRKALAATGFFQATGHGIPREIQTCAFDASARFFDLPQATKTKYLASLRTGWKGYEMFAAQSYKPGMLGDRKEGVMLSPDLPEGHPLRGVPGRFLTSLMMWPDEDLQVKQFRKPVEDYYNALAKLCSSLLDIIADTLPYGHGVFDEIKRDAACPMRLLHYPPMPANADVNRQHGASEHTDFSALTLLLQDEHPGLEVYDPVGEAWHVVTPNPDAYVVNLGDMMMMMLGSRYKSGLHRVINREPVDRYSLVYFFDGNREFRLRPVGGKGEEEAMTCEEYIFDRIRSSFGHHQKHDMALQGSD